MFRSMTKVFAGAALSFAVLGGATQAKANDYNRCETRHCEPPCHVRVCHYRWVECHEIQRVPYTHTFTKHDCCGRCYEVSETCYRNVSVCVRKRVAYYD